MQEIRPFGPFPQRPAHLEVNVGRCELTDSWALVAAKLPTEKQIDPSLEGRKMAANDSVPTAFPPIKAGRTLLGRIAGQTQ